MFEHRLHEPHPTIVYPRIPVIFIMHGNNASKKSGASTFEVATFLTISSTTLDDMERRQ